MTSLAASLAEALRAPAKLASLPDFIAATPGYTKPTHLARYTDALTRSRTEPVRIVFAAPPRHGKSEATLHAIVQALLLNPADKLVYVTYGQTFSEQQAKKAAIIAELRGLRLSEQRAEFWRTPQGGHVVWTSIGGPLTGQGARLLWIDDPFKGRAEAESAAYREATWDWYRAVARTRLEPGGSIVCMSTRWHVDDLAGRLIAQGVPYINLQAIGRDGAALWPERFPLAELDDIRATIGEYEWASLYQGEPRTKGGRVFGDLHRFDQMPEGRYRLAVGIDLAYTSKKHNDYSSAVVLAEQAGLYYVLEVMRAQAEAPRFFKDLLTLRDRYPGARFHWHASTTERGLADMMADYGLPVSSELASSSGDKFTRAQPVAAAWNAGKVAAKGDAPWLDAFASELAAFTGVNDRHDDQVDALATAFTALGTIVPIHKPAPRASSYRMAAGRGY